MKKVYLTLKKQKKANCAQTCLSMLSGKTIEEIEDLTWVDEGLHISDIKKACQCLGIPIVGRWTSEPWETGWGTRKHPVSCILHVKRKNSDGMNTHVMVCFDNIIYDPNGYEHHCSELKYKWEMLAYLEFRTEADHITCCITSGGSRRVIGRYSPYIQLKE